MKALYPLIEPYRTGKLQVFDLHTLHDEERIGSSSFVSRQYASCKGASVNPARRERGPQQQGHDMCLPPSPGGARRPRVRAARSPG